MLPVGVYSIVTDKVRELFGGWRVNPTHFNRKVQKEIASGNWRLIHKINPFVYFLAYQ